MTDALEIALAGYNAVSDTIHDTKCPYYESSPNFQFWMAGAWFKVNCLSRIESVRSGRGYSVHINDMTLKFTYKKNSFSIDRTK